MALSVAAKDCGQLSGLLASRSMLQIPRMSTPSPFLFKKTFGGLGSLALRGVKRSAVPSPARKASLLDVRSAFGEPQLKNVQIEGLGIYVPKKTMTVEDSVRMAVANRGSEIDETRLARLLKRLYKNLGSISRQWSVDPDTDRPVDWLIEAFDQALDAASWQRDDIDVVIHTGLLRGILEPSVAAVYSNILGTFRAQTFDVVDACNAWILGAQLADSLIKTGSAKKVALISTVSANNPHLTGSYKINSWKEVDFKVAGMTIGSAASVTLIGGGHVDDWGLKVSRIHDSSQVSLCICAEPETTRHLGIDTIIPPEIKDAFLDGTTAPQFYSRGAELFAVQTSWFKKLVRQALAGTIEADLGDVIMTHSAVENHYVDTLRPFGLLDRHFNIHARNGNLADNTAPVALKLAIEEGKVKGGMRVSYIGQASGASSALATFTAPHALVETLAPSMAEQKSRLAEPALP